MLFAGGMPVRGFGVPLADLVAPPLCCPPFGGPINTPWGGNAQRPPMSECLRYVTPNQSRSAATKEEPGSVGKTTSPMMPLAILGPLEVSRGIMAST